MRIIIYEENWENFYPLVHLNPQFDLRLGMKTIKENIAHYFPKTKIDFLGRDIFSYKKFNITEPTIYLSSRFIMNKKFKIVNQDVKFFAGSSVVGFIKPKPPFPNNLKQVAQNLKTIKKEHRVSGFVLNNLWDLIKYSEAMLHNHFEEKRENGKILKSINTIGNQKNLFVATKAIIDKLVTIDVTEGPVYIDRGAVIRSFSTIIGPSYIGPGTIIDRAKITKSSIGPGCRISGEVESCVFQGYANKHHEGFIGHSFIGEWVNLGASTTNSDLKNNYGPIRIKIGNKKFDTGMIKLGCFIGDHTKTGIGTLIPTGAIIGSFVNFFGGGVMPSYVPDFRWLTQEKSEKYKLESAINTAKLVMKRRNTTMTKHYEDLIRRLYTQ